MGVRKALAQICDVSEPMGAPKPQLSPDLRHAGQPKAAVGALTRGPAGTQRIEGP